MTPDRNNPPAESTDREPSSPYGPQPYGTDEVAGGSDSSPHEGESTGERKRNADASREAASRNKTADE
jgi:hypothetical protein